MEIEVKVSATTEVAVDFTVTPLEHRFPGPPDAARHRFVFSDDLGMKAVSADTPLPEATVAAVKAGCDTVLLCNSTQEAQWAAIEALIRAVESGEIPQKRIDDAWQRQKAVKERFVPRPALPSLDLIGCDEHRAVAEEMAAFQ